MVGTKIRSTPDSVVFCDPAADRDIYGARSNVQRSGVYAALKRNKTGENILNAVDTAQHGKIRRLLSLCFTEKTSRAASEIVVKHVDRFHELPVPENRTDWSEFIDFSEKVDHVVFDILGDLCYGRQFDTKEPGDNPLKAMPRTIVEFMRFYYRITRSPFLNVVLWLKPRGLDDLLQKAAPPRVRMHNEFVRSSIRQRFQMRSDPDKADKEARQDMLQVLVYLKDPDTGEFAFNEEEIHSEASVLTIAGSDSTSTVLSAIMFYLSLPDHSHRLEKLTQEIRRTFESADEIALGGKLTSCVYLKACLDEAMRMAPTSLSELPREVRPGGAVILGDYYPAGTVVGTASFSNGRNTFVFGDSETFRPERWIVDDGSSITQADVSHARESYTPFPSGRTSCLGKNIAMMELLIFVARTLWRFDMRRTPGSTFGGGSPALGWGQRDPNQFILRDVYISAREGPLLQFRRRQV